MLGNPAGEAHDEPPVPHGGLRDGPADQGVGQQERPPVRTDGDDQLVVAADEVDLFPAGEAEVDRELPVVAVTLERERRDRAQVP